MASKMIRIYMKNRKVNLIPESNLHNFKRIFAGQIDYIEEEEGEPIIAKPVIEEIKKPTPQKNVELADSSMTKKVLQSMATSKGIEFTAIQTKADLIALINA